MINEKDKATPAEVTNTPITPSLQQLEEGQGATVDNIDRVRKARLLVRISATHV